jgi:hypothetical protein
MIGQEPSFLRSAGITYVHVAYRAKLGFSETFGEPGIGTYRNALDMRLCQAHRIIISMSREHNQVGMKELYFLVLAIMALCEVLKQGGDKNLCPHKCLARPYFATA